MFIGLLRDARNSEDRARDEADVTSSSFVLALAIEPVFLAAL
jgi:hypothetical protein